HGTPAVIFPTRMERPRIMTDAVVFDDLLHEERHFPPPPDFAARAIVKDLSLYERAEADFEGFWAEQAKELEWFRPWDKVLSWSPPHARWFEGGQLNIAHNCIDRHLK